MLKLEWAGNSAGTFTVTGSHSRFWGTTAIFPSTSGFLIPILGRPLFRHFKAVVFAEGEEEIELKN